MTIHDFIVVYNETFKFIEEKYGVEAVKDLWETISKRWCTHLDSLVKEKGLEGMLEYWGGSDGTLGREKADYEIKLEGGVLSGVMHKCPSVGELLERGRELYKGSLNYCSHCQALYAPIANKYGYEMFFDVELDEAGGCVGRCRWTSY